MSSIARSLKDVARYHKAVKQLVLEASPDLSCVNIMCEKVGEPCICKLGVSLSFAPNVERVNLSSNGLEALPDALFDLPHLKELDLTGNKFTHVPHEVMRLQSLQRLQVGGNPLQAEAVAPEVAAWASERGVSIEVDVPEERPDCGSSDDNR